MADEPKDNVIPLETKQRPLHETVGETMVHIMHQLASAPLVAGPGLAQAVMVVETDQWGDFQIVVTKVPKRGL